MPCLIRLATLPFVCVLARRLSVRISLMESLKPITIDLTSVAFSFFLICFKGILNHFRIVS